MSIADRMQPIIAGLLGIEPGRIAAERTWDDLGADSLDIVDLVLAFEHEFGIEIPDAEAETILTVGDAIKYVEKAVGEQS